MDDVLNLKLEATIRDKYTVHRVGQRGKEKWVREKVIGQGTFGRVWLERQTSSGTFRAVKEVGKHVQVDHLKEIRAIAEFSKYTEYFAEFFGWYENEFSFFLAMEFVQHGTLHEHIRSGVELQHSEVKSITRQLLEGLNLIHRHNYAHRDLKPGNIFVASPAPTWKVKIGDFGISKRVADDTVLRTMNQYTMAYSAPEMRAFVRDRSETDVYAYTDAVDIWALGVVVYELLTLKRPFSSDYNLLEFYDGKKEFPKSALIERAVSRDGIDLLLKMLQPVAQERPSASQALQSLWLSSEYWEAPNSPGRVNFGQNEMSPEGPVEFKRAAAIVPAVKKKLGFREALRQMIQGQSTEQRSLRNDLSKRKDSVEVSRPAFISSNTEPGLLGLAGTSEIHMDYEPTTPSSTNFQSSKLSLHDRIKGGLEAQGTSNDGKDEISDSDALDLDITYYCKRCKEILEEGPAFELAGSHWHIDCFRCNTCGTLLHSDSNLLLLSDGSLICNDCTYSCSACNQKIEDKAIIMGDRAFCEPCFKCRNCKRKIENLRCVRTSQGVFCIRCHEGLMQRRRKKKQQEYESGLSLSSETPRVPRNGADYG